jgi:hypothetical protein
MDCRACREMPTNSARLAAFTVAHTKPATILLVEMKRIDLRSIVRFDLVPTKTTNANEGLNSVCLLNGVLHLFSAS